MSLKRNVPEMIAQKLPQKGKQTGIDTTGLRKRPQFEQIVDYLAYGQENIVYPDREAKLIREHPFMTQLDFFGMQEDQKMKWEEQTRQHEAEMIAEKTGVSAASVKATGSQTSGSTRTLGTTTESPGTKDTGTSAGPPPGGGTRSGRTHSNQEMASSSSQPATYNSTNTRSTTIYSGSMQQGVTAAGKKGPIPTTPHFNNDWRGARPSPGAGTVPANPIFKDGWQGARPSPGAGTVPADPINVPTNPHFRDGWRGPSAAAAVAQTLALQDQGVTQGLAFMDSDARKRVSDAREQVGAKKQVMQQQVAAMLAQPVTPPVTQQIVTPVAPQMYAQVSQPTPVPTMLPPNDPQKRTNDSKNTEVQNAKRIITNHNGEAVTTTPAFLTAINIIDKKAEAVQANAQANEVAIVAAAAGNGSHDLDGLANALNEPVPTLPEAATVPTEAAVTEVFNIATPRTHPRKNREFSSWFDAGDKREVESSRAAYAATRGPPENVDAGGAPYGRSRSKKKPKNVSKQLSADAQLDLMLNLTPADPIVAQDRAKSAVRDGSVNGRSEKRRKRIAANEEKTKALLSTTGSTKAIVSQDAARPAKEAPKLSIESSKPEVETTTGKQPNWAKMKKEEIVEKLLEMLGNEKSASALRKMTKAQLEALAKNPAKADKTGTAPKASTTSNVESLVKPTTVKPGKTARAQRNKGVKA